MREAFLEARLDRPISIRVNLDYLDPRMEKGLAFCHPIEGGRVAVRRWRPQHHSARTRKSVRAVNALFSQLLNPDHSQPRTRQLNLRDQVPHE